MLPNNPVNQERFEWLATAIRNFKGEASILQVKAIDDLSPRVLQEQFRQARAVDYEGLMKEIKTLKPAAKGFQPTGGGKAAISGDFVLLATEVNPVIRALRSHGIEVEAVHNHMLLDEPHLYFMHFWANDDAIKLAQGLRAALNQTNSMKPERK